MILCSACSQIGGKFRKKFGIIKFLQCVESVIGVLLNKFLAFLKSVQADKCVLMFISTHTFAHFLLCADDI